jgi:transcription termination factor Rho
MPKVSEDLNMSDSVALPGAERPTALLSGPELQAELVRAQSAANSAPESGVANAAENVAEGASEAKPRRRTTRRTAPDAADTESAEATPRRRTRKAAETPATDSSEASAEQSAQPSEEAPVVRRRGRPPKNAAKLAEAAPAAQDTQASAPQAESISLAPQEALSSTSTSASDTPQVLEAAPSRPHRHAQEEQVPRVTETNLQSSASTEASAAGESSVSQTETRERPGFEARGEGQASERATENRRDGRGGEGRDPDARGMRFRGRDGRVEGRSEGFAPNGFGARQGAVSGWREEFGPNGIRLTNRDAEAQQAEGAAPEGRVEGRTENRAPEGREARAPETRQNEMRPVEIRSVENRVLQGRQGETRNFEAREEGRGRDNRHEGRDNRFGRDRNGRDNRDNNREVREHRDNRNQNQNQNDPRERGLDRIERDALRAKPELDTIALEALALEELRRIVLEMGEANAPSLGRDELIQRALELQATAQGVAFKRGLLEILGDGRGFLRTDGYRSSDGDVYVASAQIKRFGLKTGDTVSGQVRPPKGDERHSGLLRVESINSQAPELVKARKEFEKLTPVFPDERWRLETSQENITARVIDLVSPIGKGQRGLIVAPPKAGKTTLIKSIANSLSRNHPEAELIVLLIDERPEEVTDISRSVRGEVVASTFDETAENHMRVAELVFEKAKRMVEQKKDVVVLLDSLTRLSRAANLTVSPSGRTMSGGLDPAAMHKPKKMFGAARNIEEGGSLTILATVLVDTGSRMDEYIFEEFKGTGNMDLVLDRNLFDQRIFPAIDINKSGTRRDDLLMGKDELASTFHLRRTLAQLDNDKSVTLLIDRLKNTKTNADFMQIVSRSATKGAVQTP